MMDTFNHIMDIYIYITKGNIHHNIMIIITLWLFNIAVENGP